MELFKKKIGPVFLKESNETELFIKKMTSLSAEAKGSLKQEIEKQIKIASYGLAGEKNIIYELKNSDIDMLILHDLYFEHEDLQAQIDFMIFTRKHNYVIECKNLIGNIEVDSMGNFIRSYELFDRKIKEGIYSPVTQNERHKLVIKKLRAQTKNAFMKVFFEKFFDENYKSLIVLSNPKTYLNAKFAKKEIKDQIVRADMLVAKIKEIDRKEQDYTASTQHLYDMAEFFLSRNISERSDYSKKYEEMLSALHKSQENQEQQQKEPTLVEEIQSGSTEENSIETTPIEKKLCPRCGAELVLRTAKKGDNVGKLFWGCSKFPKCHYIENLNN